MGDEKDLGKELVGPLYRDVASPAAQELGGVLERAVRVVLAPARGLLWTLEEAERWLTEAVTQRLNDRHQTRVQPNPAVTLPALMALASRGAEESLREMFANLVATAIDPATAGKAHPSFASILQQLSTDEARVLSLLHSCSSPSVGPLEFESMIEMTTRAGCDVTDSDYVRASLGNICRLGLADMKEEEFHEVDSMATPVKAIVVHLGSAATNEGPLTATTICSVRLLLVPTGLGEMFMEACIGAP